MFGLLAAVSRALYRDASAFGLPTRAAWRHARDDLSLAGQQLATVKALVPAEDGFLLAACLAVWLTAWAADGLAFRGRLGVEPIVPSGIVFVFVAAVAADRHRVAFTVARLATGLFVLLLLKIEAQGMGGGWVTTRLAPSPARSTLRAGGALAVVAIAVGGIAGPRLPGAGGDPLVDTSPRHSTRFVPDPLVDIRGRLTEQSERVAFTVDADRALLWRLTAATEFDGSAWSPSLDVRGVAGELDRPFGGVDHRVRVEQRVHILDLLSPFLPGAFAAETVEVTAGIEGDIGFDVDTSTLLFSGEDARGLSYTVESVVPSYTPAQLRAASDRPRGEAAARNLVLPADFPRDLRAMAEAIVAGQATPYDRAFALQQWFRETFTYDLNFRGDQSTNAMRDFLDGRRGYCAQFAGTSAAFARAVGLPARVAVGFTWGQRGDDDEVYVVKGKHYHAWPEVYFEGVGWVAFEPTPGRGIPGAEQYTGVAAVQAGGDDSAPPASGPAVTPPVATTALGVPGDEVIEPAAEAAAPPTTAAPARAARGDGRAWVVRAGVVTSVAGALSLAWLTALASVRRARRRRRWRDASSPAGHVLIAWAEASEALTRAGKGPQASETPLEYADRVGSRSGVAPELVRQLASDTTAAAYAPGGVEAEAVGRSSSTVAVIERSVLANLPIADRLRWAIDPRPALRRQRGRSSAGRL